jgi:hypothetical protein
MAVGCQAAANGMATSTPVKPPNAPRTVADMDLSVSLPAARLLRKLPAP